MQEEAQRKLEKEGLLVTVKAEESKGIEQVPGTPSEVKEEPKGVSFDSENLKTCMHCNAKLKHTEVVLMGVDSTDKVVSVHTKCLKDTGDNIKQIIQVHVHMEEGRSASSAQQLIIKKKAKEIFKIAARSEQRQKEEKAKEVKV